MNIATTTTVATSASSSSSSSSSPSEASRREIAPQRQQSWKEVVWSTMASPFSPFSRGIARTSTTRSLVETTTATTTNDHHAHQHHPVVAPSLAETETTTIENINPSMSPSRKRQQHPNNCHDDEDPMGRSTTKHRHLQQQQQQHSRSNDGTTTDISSSVAAVSASSGSSASSAWQRSSTQPSSAAATIVIDMATETTEAEIATTPQGGEDIKRSTMRVEESLSSLPPTLSTGTTAATITITEQASPSSSSPEQLPSYLNHHHCRRRRSNRRPLPTKRMLNSIAQQKEEEEDDEELDFQTSRKHSMRSKDNHIRNNKILLEPPMTTALTSLEGSRTKPPITTTTAKTTTSPHSNNPRGGIPISKVIEKLETMSLEREEEQEQDTVTNNNVIKNDPNGVWTLWTDDDDNDLFKDDSAWFDIPVNNNNNMEQESLDSMVGSPPKRKRSSKLQHEQKRRKTTNFVNQQQRHEEEDDDDEEIVSDPKVIAALAMISQPAQKTPQHEILNRLQESSEVVFRFARSGTNGPKSSSRGIIPRNTTTTTARHSATLPNSTVTEKACALCHVVLRYVRVRVAAGMVRGAVKVVHDMLIDAYEEAAALLVELEQKNNKTTKITSNTKNTNTGMWLLMGRDLGEQEERMEILFGLRERMAGLWCSYAHILMELGDLMAQQQQQQGQQQNMKQPQNHSPDRRRKRGRGSINEKKSSITKNDHTTDTTMTQQKVIEHVKAVLRVARSCPVVGNHSWIVLAFGRFQMSGLALMHSLQPLPLLQQQRPGGIIECGRYPVAVTIDYEDVQTKISLAIDTCWDAMDDCCYGNCNAHLATKTGAFSSKRPPRRQMTTTTLLGQQRLAQPPPSGLLQASTLPNEEEEEDIIGEPAAMAECIDGLNTFGPRLGKEQRISLEELEHSLSNILDLPEELEHHIRKTKKTSTQLKNSCGGIIKPTIPNTPFIFMDRNAIRDLSQELNDFSRLEEHLDQLKQEHLETKQQQPTLSVLQPRQSVSASPTTNILDDLPLFQFAHLVGPTESNNENILHPNPSPFKKSRSPTRGSDYDGSVCQCIEYGCKVCGALFSSRTEVDRHERQPEGCNGTKSHSGTSLSGSTTKEQENNSLVNDSYVIGWQWH